MDAHLRTGGRSRTPTHQRLLANGRVARAVVKGFRIVDETALRDREVELLLAVERDGSSYLVTHRQVVPPAALGALSIGSAVRVRVDPVDPRLLVIV